MRKFVNHISLYSADNTHSHSDWNVLRTLIQLNFKQLYLIVYIASALHFQIKKTFFNNVDFKVFFVLPVLLDSFGLLFSSFLFMKIIQYYLEVSGRN